MTGRGAGICAIGALDMATREVGHINGEVDLLIVFPSILRQNSDDQDYPIVRVGHGETA